MARIENAWPKAGGAIAQSISTDRMVTHAPKLTQVLKGHSGWWNHQRRPTFWRDCRCL